MTRLELKIPPVAVVVIVAGIMWFATLASPEQIFEFPGRRSLAAVLFTAALGVGIRGVSIFRRHRTTVNPTTPEAATAIVTTDIYAMTRNPMYLALALILAAWGLFLGNYLGLLGVPLFVAYMNIFQIAPEERALADKFGAPYDAYRRSVRRWI